MRKLSFNQCVSRDRTEEEETNSLTRLLLISLLDLTADTKLNKHRKKRPFELYANHHINLCFCQIFTMKYLYEVYKGLVTMI